VGPAAAWSPAAPVQAPVTAGPAPSVAAGSQPPVALQRSVAGADRPISLVDRMVGRQAGTDTIADLRAAMARSTHVVAPAAQSPTASPPARPAGAPAHPSFAALQRSVTASPAALPVAVPVAVPADMPARRSVEPPAPVQRSVEFAAGSPSQPAPAAPAGTTTTGGGSGGPAPAGGAAKAPEVDIDDLAARLIDPVTHLLRYQLSTEIARRGGTVPGLG
jgi:syndecan 1